MKQEYGLHELWVMGLLTKILEYDVSSMKDGEVRNLNGRESIEGDIGIDGSRGIYSFRRGEWVKFKKDK
jgi:hypothetical protein